MEELINKALNIYEYGSIVYGTYVEGVSDRDYIVIVDDHYQITDEQIELNNCHYNIFSASRWQEKLNNNEVDALEVYFLPKKYVVKETIAFKTTIIPSKVREQFSRTASNSWVKCKKKLTVEKDYNPRVGKKSLWHSLRIISFGTQILCTGRICDYGILNHLYDKIVNNDLNQWEYYYNNYKVLYNNMKSQFRLAESKSFVTKHI